MFQIARRFSRLIQRIQPGPVAVLRARSQFAQIRARLGRSFLVSRVVPLGSHAKGTALQRFSDVDILAVLRRREARWGGGYVSSDTLFRSVRDDLVGRYSDTETRRDGQAVAVRFAQGAHPVDVVPAVFQKAAANGYPVYRIPDGPAVGILPAQTIHPAYFGSADRRTGGNPPPLVHSP